MHFSSEITNKRIDSSEFMWLPVYGNAFPVTGAP